MVYCGRPSSGCTTCRKRRIKCDEGRPICGQCIKSKRYCLGYREDTDILFRNENAATALRVKRERGRSKIGSSTTNLRSIISPERRRSSVGSLSDSENILIEHRSPSLPFSQTFDCTFSALDEDVAIKFLFDNFDRIPRHTEASHAYLEFLPALFAQAPSNSALSAATAAISLGTWGRYLSRPDCLVEARKRYGEAIVRANTAIRDPVAAKKNETLMAILLFALFEALNVNPGTISQRNLHTKGAIALVKYRGSEIFEDETSRKLFEAVRQQMMISQLNQPESSQDGLASSQFWSSRTQTTPADTLTSLIFEIPVLRASSMKLLSTPRSNEIVSAVCRFIDSCKAVDSTLGAWLNSLDAHWRPVIVSRVPEPADPSIIDWENVEAYPGDIIAYHDIWVTGIWNTYRNSRMFINAIILQCQAWLAAGGKDLMGNILSLTGHPNCVASKEILQEMVSGTCAAVPFQVTTIENSSLKDVAKDLDTSPSPSFNHVQIPEFPSSEPTFMSLSNTGYDSDHPNLSLVETQENLAHHPNHLAKSLGAYYLMWPLFVAQAAITIPTYQRRWLKGRLMYISQKFGLKQAAVLASSDERLGQIGRPLFSEARRENQFREG